jgi:hypothetical protein
MLTHPDKADDVRVVENENKFDKGKVKGMPNSRKTERYM